MKNVSKPKTQSRNQRRKAEYAALADRRSRNQDALEKPVVGRLVWVTTEAYIVADPKTGELIERVRPLPPTQHYQKVVHDDNAPKIGEAGDEDRQLIVTAEHADDNGSSATTAPSAVNNKKKVANAPRVRRQQFAWNNCQLVRNGGEHNFVNRNCHTCGCPRQVA